MGRCSRRRWPHSSFLVCVSSLFSSPRLGSPFRSAGCVHFPLRVLRQPAVLVGTRRLRQVEDRVRVQEQDQVSVLLLLTHNLQRFLQWIIIIIKLQISFRQCIFTSKSEHIGMPESELWTTKASIIAPAMLRRQPTDLMTQFSPPTV